MTAKYREFQAASKRLSAGAFLALLPNRALELPALAIATASVPGASNVSPDRGDFSTPGLRGLLNALGAAQSPAALRAQTMTTNAPQTAPSEHYYVALELCHWQVEMGGARWMAHGQRLNLAAAERAEITAALASLFATPDAQLIEHRNGELSLWCDASTPAVQAAFPDEVLGCDLKSMLPTPKVWQRYLNEAQMLLADLPINRARAARGELVVNSVWFWGAQPVATDVAPVSLSYHGNDSILLALSESDSAQSVQIYDYRALFGAELALAVEQLPRAAHLWLNDGRIFQERARAGFLRRLWQKTAAKIKGKFS